ncbi:type-II metacaspase, partial [Trifolium medium]|nr:type-II metacaspase [Trifolium medium]
MAEQPSKKAVLVGIGEMGASNSNPGAFSDVHGVKNMLTSIHRMRPEDIVVMVDSYDTPADKNKTCYPTAQHVHGQVVRAYESTRSWGDMMLYMSCHGTRGEVSLVSNNTAHVEKVLLADGTGLTDHEFRELSKLAPSETYLTVPSLSPVQRRLNGHKVGLLLSACQTGEFAHPAVPPTGIGGRLTSLMIDVDKQIIQDFTWVIFNIPGSMGCDRLFWGPIAVPAAEDDVEVNRRVNHTVNVIVSLNR